MDNLLCRILIGIREAQAASPFTKEVKNFSLEPGWAAELEGAGDMAGNQGEKIFQRRPVRTKTLGKLKKDRPQFPVQN